MDPFLVAASLAVHGAAIHVTSNAAGDHQNMSQPHDIEIYSAGCVACNDVVTLVSRLAGPGSKVSVLDMHDAQVAARARVLGIRTVPTVVIDGKLVTCCARRGADAVAIKALLSLP